jgi:hypothetical protein
LLLLLQLRLVRLVLRLRRVVLWTDLSAWEEALAISRTLRTANGILSSEHFWPPPVDREANKSRTSSHGAQCVSKRWILTGWLSWVHFSWGPSSPSHTLFPRPRP